jgi:hypothetical protein
MSPAAARRRLSHILDSIGVGYTVRHTPDGVPYAGFRVSPAGMEPCSLTAIVRDQVLQLTCHEALCVPAHEEDLWRLNRVNLEWGLGHVWHSAEASCYQATGSLYLPSDGDTSAQARRSLESLLLCVSYLRHYPECLSGVDPPSDDAPDASFRNFLAGEVLDLTGVPGGDDVGDAEAALRAAGYRFRYTDAGRALANLLTTRQGWPVVIEVYKHEARLLWLRGWPQARTGARPPAADMPRIQEIAGCLLFGDVCAWRDRRQTIYRCAVPLAGVEIDARLMGFLVGQAMAALERWLI